MLRRFVGVSLFIYFSSALVCVNAANLQYNIDSVAGSSWVGDGGTATKAILLQSEGVAADTNGNLYIADSADHRVRRVSPDGIIRTVAGTGVRGFSGDGGPASTAQLNSPYGLACDIRGNVYVADLGNARVRQIAPDGTITTVAGGGTLVAGGSNEGSPAVLVALSGPRNLVIDSSGNLYISDFSGQRVYRLGTDGILHTAAGTGILGSSGEGGVATRAQLNFPTGLAIDAQGSLYIADSGNHLVRKVTRGTMSSVATAATPTGVALDGLGTLYIADPSAGQIVRMAAGVKTMFLSASVNDLAFSGSGYLFASGGNAVLQIAPTGVMTTSAGGGTLAYGDSGNARSARLNHPSGAAVDSSGNLYIADRDNNRIRRVGMDGTISTIAGTGVSGNFGDGASADQAQLSAPSAVSVDSSGNLYIADTGNQRVRKVSPSGRITAATNGGLLSPVYAIADSSGYLYIADANAGTIFKAGSNGIPAVLVSGLASPRGLALDESGNLYFTEAGGARVQRRSPDGTLVSLGAGTWSIPRGVAVDSAGNVFVADTGLQQIIRIDSAANVAPVAGTGAAGFSGDGGAALAAQLGYPWDVSLGVNGALVIADLDNNRVRVLSPVAQAAVSSTILPDAVNAASLAPGPVTAGMLLLLRNSGINAGQIQDTQILFGSTPGRILSADSNGILVVTPPEIAGLTSITITILYQATASGAITVPVADSAPALFADSSGQAMANNEDGLLNSQGNPAARGSVISLYGTGLGSSGAPLGVSIGNYSAEVLYAGPVAGYPGLFQVNARVPSGYLAPGISNVVVNVGLGSSQTGISIWVK